MKRIVADDVRDHILFHLNQASKPLMGTVIDEPLRFLTVGIEHEFFLEDSLGNPATHDLSQSLLKRVSESSGWKVSSRGNSIYGDMINRVSMEEIPGRYTVLKYDHHPHLMEIAFTYSPLLHELYDHVTTVLDTVQKAAISIGAKIVSKPFSSLSADDERLNSPLPEYEALRHYRKVLAGRQNRILSRAAVNYAAEIAATQIHIGGTRWWENPRFVSRLYAFEPETVALSFGMSSIDLNALKSGLLRRWKGYAEVFQGCPLVGFPDLEKWTIDSWIEALFHSPLYSSENQEWAGKSLNEIGYFPFESINHFLRSVRDLQIIRPKLFGTLEFRSDACASGAKEMLALAALRLGMCAAVAAQTDPSDMLDFYISRNRWWSIATGEIRPSDGLVAIQAARYGLQSRGLNEEIYLEPFNNMVRFWEAA